MTFVIEINWSVFKPERETVCDCEWEKKESNKHTKTETQFKNSRNNFFVRLFCISLDDRSRIRSSAHIRFCASLFL